MFSAHDKPTIVNEGISPEPMANLPPIEPVNIPAAPEPPKASIPVVPSVPVTSAVPSAQVKPNIPSGTIPPHHSTKPLYEKVLFVLIPAGLILGSMALISFLLSQYKKPAQSVVEATPIPTLAPATPVPTPKEDPYKDWKAYVNRAAQVSFRYSPLTKLKEDSTTSSKTVISITKETDGSVMVAQVISATDTPDNLIKQYVSGGAAVDKATEEDTTISGITGKQGIFNNVSYAYIEKETTTFLFVNPTATEKDLSTQILGTVKLVSKGVTPDWQTYSNTSAGYSLSYPPSWILSATDNSVATASAKTISIRKSDADKQYQNLVIQVTGVGPKDNVQLSATELISSLQNLSGWHDTPNLDFRSFGIAQAQIISGVKDGAWQEYGVFWYRNTLVEVEWKDTMLRQEQDNFDDILSTLKFK